MIYRREESRWIGFLSCRVGKTGTIQLYGDFILDEHCLLLNDDERVEIQPQNGSQTYVNGRLVEDTIELKTGDNIILGDNHVFKFRHPQQGTYVGSHFVTFISTV